jgi:hypothetical protein
MANDDVSSSGTSTPRVNTEKVQPVTNVDDRDIEISRVQSKEDREVFKETQDGVQFRNVSWQRATIIFLKIQFAMSILSVPGALVTLGAVGGALSIVGWEILNTCQFFPP